MDKRIDFKFLPPAVRLDDHGGVVLSFGGIDAVYVDPSTGEVLGLEVLSSNDEESLGDAERYILKEAGFNIVDGFFNMNGHSDFPMSHYYLPVPMQHELNLATNIRLGVKPRRRKGGV